MYQEIRRIPYDLLIMQSYKNHMKNLKIKVMITNFIILILSLELLNSLSFIAFMLPFWPLIFNFPKLRYFKFLINIGNFASHLSVVTRQLITPLLSLMMKFLWLVYRKYDYKFTLIRWSVYIVVRTLMICIFRIMENPPSFLLDNYESLSFLIFEVILGFLYIFDFIQFIYFAREFYLHLKSREKEIKLFYYDHKAYLDSKFLRIHFLYSTILVVLSLFFFTLGFAFTSFISPLRIFAITLFPNNVDLIYIYTDYLDICCTFPPIIVYKILITLNYLYLFLIIVHRSIRDSNKLANINNHIKPIVQKYHHTLYTPRNFTFKYN